MELNEKDYEKFSNTIDNNAELFGFSMYLNSLKNYPILSKERTRELGYALCNGDKNARELLIVSNLRLVIYIAKNYLWSNIEIEDLVGYGNIGLLKAADKFDATNGTLFHTYAYSWIVQSIQRNIEKYNSTIRIPVNINNLMIKIKKVEASLIEKVGQASVEDIAKELDIPTSKVLSTIEICSMGTISMYSPIGKENDSSIEDILEDSQDTEEMVINNTNRKSIINFLIKNLNEQQSKVLLLRSGLVDGEQHTFEYIGNVIGVTRARAYNINKEAIERLHNCKNLNILRDLLSA